MDQAEETIQESLADYHKPGTSYDLPEPPRDWLYELHNSMRHFGGQCGTKCLFPECK